MADLLAVEYEESAFVREAQAQGLPIEYRSDCAPQCILAVKLIVTPRADALPTTTGYSWPWRP